MPSTIGHVPKRAILYTKVSTDEQARSGYSLAQQIDAITYLPHIPVNRGSRKAYEPSLSRRALSAANNRAEATASPAAKYSRLPTTISPPPALASQ